MMWLYYTLILFGGLGILVAVFISIWQSINDALFVKLTLVPLFTAAFFSVPFGLYALCITGVFNLLGWLP